MTTPIDRMIGFDGSADDTSLVVMHRDHDGSWRVETTDGPDAAELARMATGIFGPHQLGDRPGRMPVAWGDLIAGWSAPIP